MPDEASSDDAASRIGTGDPAGRSPRPRHRVRWSVLTIGLTILVGMTFVFARNLSTGTTPPKLVIVGRNAPSFDLPGLDGPRLTSAGLGGQLYVLNFWASWCVPCREEAPQLVAFARKWQGRVQLIGVNWNDSAGDARGFIREFGIAYPQVVDTGGGLGVEYGLTGVPETYVVDGNGVVMAGLIGATTAATLDTVVNDVLTGRIVTQRNAKHRSGPGG